MNIYCDLAQKTVSQYLHHKTLPDIKKLPAELLTKRAGCFVSIHNKKDMQLRGCIGTILPVYKNLASEIISNAVTAAANDPRFSPIKKTELDNLSFSVDVLSSPEAIDSDKDLNIKKYGVIVKSPGGRTGLLLPDLDGVDNVNTQIKIAREKAGISPNEDIHLYRFTVQRYED